MQISEDEQVRIMLGQLENFPSVTEKMFYMSSFFDTDPMFSKAARDRVRGEVSKQIKEQELCS